MQLATAGIGLTPEETAFMSAARDLMVNGGNLREAMLRSLSECLGSSAALALMKFMGDEAFSRPTLLVQRLEEVFGTGSPILLVQLAESARSIVVVCSH